MTQSYEYKNVFDAVNLEEIKLQEGNHIAFYVRKCAQEANHGFD